MARARRPVGNGAAAVADAVFGRRWFLAVALRQLPATTVPRAIKPSPLERVAPGGDAKVREFGDMAA